MVSGLARGIDRAAHIGSLMKTIGISGCGITVYPLENQDLYEELSIRAHFMRRRSVPNPLLVNSLLATVLLPHSHKLYW